MVIPHTLCSVTTPDHLSGVVVEKSVAAYEDRNQVGGMLGNLNWPNSTCNPTSLIRAVDRFHLELC